MSATFHHLNIADVRRETADTVSIAFELKAENEADFKFIAGQYLTLKADIKGEDVRRSYSICSSPSQGELRVAVKQVEGGKFSTYANTELAKGQTMEVMVPNGNFLVEPNAAKSGNYVFYAAGSGITPILSMIRSILETEAESKVFLYYGNKSAEDTIFKTQLDELAAQYSNFKLTYILSREDTGESTTYGRIDENKCSHFYDADLADLKIEGIYSCGPQEMIEMIKEFYISKGLLHKVHFELFTTPVATETETVDDGVSVDSQVTVIIDDEEYEFELSTDGPDILQAAQDNDADVPFSCKGGVCCTCRAKVLEGTVKMAVNFALEEDEVANGFILTCQAHPTSEKVVVSYDEF
ncbi:MAG: FAD-binding oxidoreductase [Flavobacteriales bacterium]|nr:FAD-binding oxidoreductase [Flavobacteriales bacterium]